MCAILSLSILCVLGKWQKSGANGHKFLLTHSTSGKRNTKKNVNFFIIVYLLIHGMNSYMILSLNTGILDLH